MWALTALAVMSAAIYICTLNITCSTNPKILIVEWKRFTAPTVVATLCLLTAGAGRICLLTEFVYLSDVLLVPNLLTAGYYYLTLIYPNLSITSGENYYLNPQWVPLCGQIVFMVRHLFINLI